jgi:hypothetical protein
MYVYGSNRLKVWIVSTSLTCKCHHVSRNWVVKCRYSSVGLIVADEGAGECMDPEGNGVNPGKGNGGGPGPPRGEQDKQLISNSGETTLPWDNQEGRKTSPA